MHRRSRSDIPLPRQRSYNALPRRSGMLPLRRRRRLEDDDVSQVSSSPRTPESAENNIPPVHLPPFQLLSIQLSTKRCTSESLLHKLRPCESVVEIESPQECAMGCRDPHNCEHICRKRTEEDLQSHLRSKCEELSNKLDKLSIMMELKAGWKEDRVARMYVAWKNEYLRQSHDSSSKGRCTASPMDKGTTATAEDAFHTPSSPSRAGSSEQEMKTNDEDIDDRAGLTGDEVEPSPSKTRLVSKLPVMRWHQHNNLQDHRREK